MSGAEKIRGGRQCSGFDSPFVLGRKPSVDWIHRLARDQQTIESADSQVQGK